MADIVREIRDELCITLTRKVAQGGMGMVYEGSKVLILIFLVAIGGSYFFAGAGQFGGGGVDVPW